jgi:Lamin Tail Domain/Bacterial Ig-like domain
MMKQLTIITIVCLCLFFSVHSQAQNRYDIVITEIMSDPTPQIGLPNFEWIEIRNTTSFSINIQNWRVGDAGGISGALPNFLLQPDSSAIICGSTAAATMQQYGRTFSVTSFPSLDNDGEMIFIRSNNGITIHAVEYSKNWHSNAVKSDGGWTLEMMDIKNPCSGSSNWKSSTDARGGTPGIKNSVDGNNKDVTPPVLIRAFATDSVTLLLSFNEPLDSLSGATITNYQISDGIGTALSASSITPVFNIVQLKVNTLLQRNKVYTITANNVKDCAGNTIGSFNSAKLGLSSVADSLDVIINEVLFNPKSDGTDYVELYNRSTKIINLKELFIANRNSTNLISSLKQISLQNIAMFPGEFLVLSEDETIVKRQFVAKNLSAFINISSMPSYSDDKGNVILTNNAGKIIDELAYDDKWHFALISNTEGIALERIDPNAKTQNKDNWHSASKDAGYGTPSYQNSQFRLDLQVQGDVNTSPEVFSPDNDGTDDFLTISYRFPETGYVMNITVYDAGGRPVKSLQRNAVCSQSGNFRWDGLNDKMQQLPVGPYIIFTEVFNLAGKVKRFKNQVVLARRF